MKPWIIPFFLNHQGCPCRCIYCDQNRSTGQGQRITPRTVRQGLQEGLASPRRNPKAPVEAAFFGGTFTLLPRDTQIELLEATKPFLESGQIQGIRLSTRPDALDSSRTDLLAEYGVGTVEIGAQSMDDRVLATIERGYNFEVVARASSRLKATGIKVGIQIMTGLPGEDRASCRLTRERTIALAPQQVRIYPLLVLRDTRLARMYSEGEYTPPTLDEALETATDAWIAFRLRGIEVMRVGLQPGTDLDQSVLAGPYHPAFGELVKSRVYYRCMYSILRKNDRSSSITKKRPRILVSPSHLSQALGQRRTNINRLAEGFGMKDLHIQPETSLAPGRILWQGKEYSVLEAAAGRKGDK